MGTTSTKHEENVVADKVDKSTINTRDFTILRLHGNTGALIIGSLATLLLLYAVYRAVGWRRAKMVQERADAEQGAQAQVRMGLGRFVPRAAPLPCNAPGICDDCAEAARPPANRQQPDMLQGHFQPA